MFALLRILIGLVFVVSGAEKLLHPYQNFLYALQAYHVLPGWGETAVAILFPWMELFVGIFTMLGLWTAHALKAVLLLCAVFIVVVGQALLRSLDIDQCGCFGSLVHVPPRLVIVFDSCVLLLTFMLLRNPKSRRLSLDGIFSS